MHKLRHEVDLHNKYFFISVAMAIKLFSAVLKKCSQAIKFFADPRDYKNVKVHR